MSTIRVIAADLKENDTFKMAGVFVRVESVQRSFSDETAIKFYELATGATHLSVIMVNRDMIFKISRKD